MKKLIFTAALSTLLIGCTYFDPYDHAVLVDLGVGTGSGVVVPGGVLTAAHVHDIYDEEERPYTLHYQGEEYEVTGFKYVGERGTNQDWVLLETDVPNPAPIYCGDLETGQKLQTVGYPASGGTPVELELHGRVASLDTGPGDGFEHMVGLDLAGAPGISGAGVFNEWGEVVGLYVGGMRHGSSHHTGLMTRLPEELCEEHYEDRDIVRYWNRFVRWLRG